MKWRVDFGRVVPGVIILFVGLVALAILAVSALVAFLFSGIIGWGAFWTSIDLLLIPAALFVAGIITMMTGVSWWGGGEGWLSGTARIRAAKDYIRLSERLGEVIGVGVSFLVFLFFYLNQLKGAAFFTSSFGTAEQFFFYAPLFAGMALSLVRAFYGRRNGVRPFDSLNALFLTLAAYYLVTVFPFDFTHFGDLLSAQLGFLFWWLTNDIGRVIFTLAGIFSFVNFVYTAALYTAVRNQMHYSAASSIAGRV